MELLITLLSHSTHDFDIITLQFVSFGTKNKGFPYTVFFVENYVPKLMFIFRG